jgi:Protein of unknown function (DUF3131)
MKSPRSIALSLATFIALSVVAEPVCVIDITPLPAWKYPHRQGPLTAREHDMARICWQYFEANYQPETGLVNAVHDYPSTTMWDTASYLAALVSARELAIIDKVKFDARLMTLLRTFVTMDLFREEMPNKAYHAKTAQKVDYGNNPGEIGYSALDIGRLLLWFKIIKERYPEHGNAIDRVVMRWDFRRIVDNNGTLYGANVEKDKRTLYVQEGRLGYEEYAAKGFQLWGFNTTRASMPEPFNMVHLFGIRVPYDTRDPRFLSQHNYVVSESYVLDGVEVGWDHPYDRATDEREHSQRWVANFAHRVYQAQENRFREAGILTARSEHQLDREPYFVYDTVYTTGYAWNTITDTGKFVPEMAAISLKAALGMWVLWESPYTDLLFEAIAEAYDPKRGYYEGIFERGTGPIKTQTANNNGIMLEALLFKVQGKILKWGRVDGGVWESTNADPFAENSKGRPIFVRRQRNCRDGRIETLMPRLFGGATNSDSNCLNCAPDPDCLDEGKPSLKPRAFGPNFFERAFVRAPDTAEICLTCEDDRFKHYSPSWQVRPR